VSSTLAAFVEFLYRLGQLIATDRGGRREGSADLLDVNVNEVAGQVAS
jgi:hypothetical protein